MVFLDWMKTRAGAPGSLGLHAAEGVFAFLDAAAFARVEDALAEADVFRGGFDEFVGLDVFNRALEAEADRRGQAGRFVRAGGAEVGMVTASERPRMDRPMMASAA